MYWYSVYIGGGGRLPKSTVFHVGLQFVGLLSHILARSWMPKACLPLNRVWNTTLETFQNYECPLEIFQCFATAKRWSLTMSWTDFQLKKHHLCWILVSEKLVQSLWIVCGLMWFASVNWCWNILGRCDHNEMDMWLAVSNYMTLMRGG